MFHPFKHSIFFSSEAQNSELPQTMNRNPKINVFLKDYIMLPRLFIYCEKLNSFKLFSNSPLLSTSRWSGPLFLTMNHIIKVPGSAQSKEACHTVQRAFSLTAMALSPLCHMPAEPVPQRTQTFALDGRTHLKYKHSLWPLLGHTLLYLLIAANHEHNSQSCLQDD